MELLVVDNSAYIQERFQDLLGHLSFIKRLHTAGSLREALEVVELYNVQVAIIDVDLPGNVGPVLLQILKQDYPHINVIMLMNNSLQFVANLCKRIGAEHCLDKANDFERLPSILNSLLQSSENVS